MLAALLPSLLLVLAAPCVAGLPVQPDARVEAEVDSLLRASWAKIYDGRLDAALAAIDRVIAIAPGDPRIGLFRFRVLRVNFPDDVHEKERAQTLMPEIMESLDRTIADCDSMLAEGGRDAAAYLYRGWAAMMKAQTHAIAGGYWSAGSEAKKGKRDLDRFYVLHPEGDPDASAILGGYLYFADILPGVVKFLKWIVRVPGGDRERGLELLAEAARSDGYTRDDTRLVLGVIYYLFEGRIRRGAGIIRDLAEVYPWHPRVVELRGSMSLLYPESTMEAIAIESRVIDGWGDRITGWDDLFVYRLRWSRARLLHQAGFYDEAIRELEIIADHAPPHPFWITPRSLLALIELEASLGRRETALGLCERLRNEEWGGDYADEAERLCRSEPNARDVAVFTGLGPARQALYAGDLARARELHAGLVSQYGDGLRLRFFEAELLRLEQRFDEAEVAYGQVVREAKGDALAPLRMISLLRLGEMHIDRDQYGKAKEMYEKAREMEPKATMLGTMIRGRLMYIEREK